MVFFEEFIDACLYVYRNIGSVYASSWKGDDVSEYIPQYEEKLLIIARGWWIIAIALVAVLLLTLAYDFISISDTADAINAYSRMVLRDAKSCGLSGLLPWLPRCSEVQPENFHRAERKVPKDVGRRLRRQMGTIAYNQRRI